MAGKEQGAKTIQFNATQLSVKNQSSIEPHYETLGGKGNRNLYVSLH